MSTPRIVVVGSSNADLVIKSNRLPAPGETVTGGDFVMVPGGKGANQAVAAARLGADVVFVARVGNDLFGAEALKGYRDEGINTDLITIDPELATGIALILVADDGENLISVASGANHALLPEHVESARDCIESADALLLQLEVPLPTVERAAVIAANAGVPVILDPAPAPEEPLPGSLLQHVSYLTPNETEASRLAGIRVTDQTSAAEAASKLLDAGPGYVLVTMGSKGVRVASCDGIADLPSVGVDAVDSTAAGDAFNGALAVGVGRGLKLEEAAREACLVGALSVTKMGAQPSLPTAAEVRAFANEMGLS